ncbi:uncharacterized protein N7484_009828 [Penicillium longicatenatum]|uniref:uncharacterized protein n=1 Tax=Penicillium longicatenatum TaxID=1561947 RepID=UPI0025468325|nr:uncharacterized protein N7484_009828 [Penicillium longicatenatum]KAJ5636515.1 hypothetical protein N7484_009828 [Penicillium longicatenatum]
MYCPEDTPSSTTSVDDDALDGSVGVKSGEAEIVRGEDGRTGRVKSLALAPDGPIAPPDTDRNGQEHQSLTENYVPFPRRSRRNSTPPQ